MDLTPQQELEVNNLAMTLKRNKLAHSEMEAKRMAMDMLHIGKKVADDFKKRDDAMYADARNDAPKDAEQARAKSHLEQLTTNMSRGRDVRINVDQMIKVDKSVGDQMRAFEVKEEEEARVSNQIPQMKPVEQMVPEDDDVVSDNFTHEVQDSASESVNELKEEPVQKEEMSKEPVQIQEEVKEEESEQIDDYDSYSIEQVPPEMDSNATLAEQLGISEVEEPVVEVRDATNYDMVSNEVSSPTIQVASMEPAKTSEDSEVISHEPQMAPSSQIFNQSEYNLAAEEEAKKKALEEKRRQEAEKMAESKIDLASVFNFNK